MISKKRVSFSKGPLGRSLKGFTWPPLGLAWPSMWSWEEYCDQDRGGPSWNEKEMLSRYWNITIS